MENITSPFLKKNWKWYFGIMYEYYNTSQHEITQNFLREGENDVVNSNTKYTIINILNVKQCSKLHMYTDEVACI